MAPLAATSGEENDYLASNAIETWFRRCDKDYPRPSSLPPAAVELLVGLASLAAARRPGWPVGRAHRALVNMLATDSDGEVTELAVLHSAHLLPTVAFVLDAGDAENRSLACQALLHAALRPQIVGFMLSLTPPLVPLLLARLRDDGPSAAEAAAAVLVRIAHLGGAAGISEVESWGAGSAILDSSALLDSAMCPLADLLHARGNRPDEGTVARLAAAGAVPRIVAALAQEASADEGAERLMEAALTVLSCLARDSPPRAEWLACSGALPPLVRALAHPSHAVAAAAAKAVTRLVAAVPDTSPGHGPACLPVAPHAVVRRLMGCGALHALVPLLRRRPVSIASLPFLPASPAVEAARAITMLAFASHDLPAVVAAEPGAIEGMLGLLDPAAGDWSVQGAQYASTFLVVAARSDDALLCSYCSAVPSLLRLLQRPPPRDGDDGGGGFFEEDSAMATYYSLACSCMILISHIDKSTAPLTPKQRKLFVRELWRLRRSPEDHVATIADVTLMEDYS
jgi:hypothetical protein